MRAELVAALLAIACGRAPISRPVSVETCTPTWQSIGPYGSPTHWIAVDPTHPATVYAVTEAGIRRSTDRGVTWAPLPQTPDGSWSRSLEIDPKHPQTLYAAGNGFSKSEDGGDTWQSVGPSSGFHHITVAPGDPRLLYGAGQPPIGLYKSADAGATWSALGDGIVGQVRSIVVDPKNADTVLVGTMGMTAQSAAGEGVFKTTDGGRHWVRVLTSTTGVILALDPAVVYAGNADGVFTSADGGTTWSSALALDGKPVVSLVVDPMHPHTAYAGTLDGGVFKIIDHTAKQTGLSSDSILSLAIDPTDPNTIYAGSTRGPYVTRDGGTSWSLADADLQTRCPCHNIEGLTIDPTSSNTIYATGAYGGGFVTRDGGASWSPTVGIASNSPKHVVFDPRDPKSVYTGSNAQIGRGGVFASHDAGRTWSRREVGHPGYVWTLGIDPVEPHTIYAATNGFGLWKSTDAAETWVQLEGLPKTILAVDVGPDAVYATTKVGMWRSVDGGSHWALAHPAPPEAWVLSRQRSDPQRFYAGTFDQGVFRISDEGKTWTPLNTGLTNLQITREQGVLIDPTDSKIMYVGTEAAGVFASVDGGATWSAINDGLFDLHVWSLALDPEDSHILYAGTVNRSVFVRRSCRSRSSGE